MEVIMQMICGDALEKLKAIPDGSVDMVLTDPPYNSGKAEWDKIPNYVQWCVTWLKECGRCLKPNGVLYFWHNNVSLIAELLCAVHGQTELVLQSFCVWDKSENYRFRTWANRDPDGAFAPRSWFNTCEYCLHFFNAPQNRERKHSGFDSNPECYRPLKEWYASEKARLDLT
ncbi:MAG: DNA methyltransferase, partial [Clostridia bacterium]